MEERQKARRCCAGPFGERRTGLCLCARCQLFINFLCLFLCFAVEYSGLIRSVPHDNGAAHTVVEVQPVCAEFIIGKGTAGYFSGPGPPGTASLVKTSRHSTPVISVYGIDALSPIPPESSSAVPVSFTLTPENTTTAMANTMDAMPITPPITPPAFCIRASRFFMFSATVPASLQLLQDTRAGTAQPVPAQRRARQQHRGRGQAEPHEAQQLAANSPQQCAKPHDQHAAENADH